MTSAIPATMSDPINAAILAVSEDRIAGFHRDPFVVIAGQCGLPVEEVCDRIAAMLDAGTIRRVRQTLLATNLAHGALAAWKVPQERLQEAFDDLFENDPFSGHVVIRSSEPGSAGAEYRLWTTLKVPQGYSLEKHAAYLAQRIGASTHRLMRARALFALGVGHTRRRGLEPGARSDQPAAVQYPAVTELSEREWRVLSELKRELAIEEVRPNPWQARAESADETLDGFCEVAAGLAARGVIGRFSTFLEHVKPTANGERATRYNALFHWAVPPGQEIAAGREVGRHHVITHAYWREAGPDFRNVNVMAVAHGMEKETVLAHKAGIDAHLAEAGIDVTYTNVFWGGRSEIKPSEVAPAAYRDWCIANGLDPEAMREESINGLS
jgi:DNA-binding Lrp family transcriptional regulator